VITFIVICAVMVVAAVASIARPLLRPMSGSRSLVGTIAVAILIPLVTTGLYLRQSNWDWQQVAASASQQATIDEMVAKLEQRLQQSPNDMQGWLMLGRSYLTLERPARAVDAYQHAYDLSGGANTEAALGLGESLVLVDEAALRGRAGQLFEAVLVREPGNPTALWYGAIAALVSNDLPKARQRMADLLAQNPPQQVREIVERQIQDIDQQLGNKSSPPAQVAAKPIVGSARTLIVKVSLAPALVGKADPRAPLFIMARGENGPPLAVVRRAMGDLPVTVKLSDADAMVAGRNLSSVPQVQVVARVSKSGAPQAQSGDLFGEATYTFKETHPGTVDIVIARAVP